MWAPTGLAIPGPYIRLKPKSPDAFDNVFGADCFIHQFPNIFTDGVDTVRIVGDTRVGKRVFYYVVVDGKIWHDSSFFSGAEVQKYMNRC